MALSLRKSQWLDYKAVPEERFMSGVCIWLRVPDSTQLKLRSDMDPCSEEITPSVSSKVFMVNEVDHLGNQFGEVSSLLEHSVNWAKCKDGDTVGEGDPKKKKDNIDTSNGVSILLDRSDMEISCCGFVKGWEFYAKTNTGTVYLQVWRPAGATWTLVGENQYTVTSTDNEIYVSLATTDRIQVQSGDYVGVYHPASPIVSYKQEGSSNEYRITTSVGALPVGGSFSWNSVSQGTKRKYGLRADLTNGNNPSITNLDTTVSFTDDTPVGTLFTLVVSDADSLDPLSTTMTTINSNFAFNANTLQVSSTTQLPVGTTNLNFQVTDGCGNSDTGTLTIVVTNKPPEIHNLPFNVDVSESQTAEKELCVVNATDPSQYDTVTCNIQSVSPATTIFSARISSGSLYSVYLQANPSLSYDSVNAYDITIACTDTKDTVTGTLNVYITQNNPPVFTNLQASVNVTATTTTGTSVYTVTSSDIEGDQLYYNMTCSLPTCPFAIYHSGDVRSTNNLIGYTQAGYDLYIYVYDGRSLVGPKTLTIVVTGINTAPSITNLPLASAITVSENSALGASVFQVSYSDIDATDTHVFTTTYSPAAGGNIFTTNAATGLISTSFTTNINYESLAAASIDVNIQISDGTDSATSNLTITILDLNEAPIFGKNLYYLTGPEGSAGSSVGTPVFDVTDPDTGATQKYSINCPEFNMNTNTAAVTLATEYDLDISGTASVVTCNVTVTDGQLTATSVLQVTLNNINDNTPTFSQSSYTFFAQPNVGVGTVLGSILATDADIGAFGTLSYTLDQISLGNQYFGVQSNGDFYVNAQLTTFSNGQTLSVTAIVTDSGGLNDTATITIVIPQSTTAAPTTTTDRRVTFAEDPRNVAWMSAAVVIFIGIVGLMVYQSFRFGDYARIGKWCQKSSRRPSFRPRQSYRLSHYNTRRIQQIPEIRYNSHIPESDWKPWQTGTQDL
ncbi:protocadherin Fat 4-like [Saccostrea echinata]|uniref:protocadherin Fat 4-like n=1 Tax=Saccostrea echinata TaxID=191078 RepID=UPI002A8262F1|nr:protocadherin Fat 4-like [Saccostrea echinata]